MLETPDLGVGHPLVARLTRDSEAKTGPSSWITQDTKHRLSYSGTKRTEDFIKRDDDGSTKLTLQMTQSLFGLAEDSNMKRFSIHEEPERPLNQR